HDEGRGRVTASAARALAPAQAAADLVEGAHGASVTLTRLVDRLRPWNAPLEIPECPDGWTVGTPDYVGIGAQRCGTSWWYDAMRRHPAIERSPIGKEVHYFDRFWQGDAPDDIAAEYASLFPRPPGQVTGEWTPRYLADFWTAP